MLPSRTIGISIDRNWREVYEAFWQPLDFAKWASGLVEGQLAHHGGIWTARGPAGPITIRFSPHNDFGVLDHVVEVAPGVEIYVPLRIIANGDGADVQLTLFRQPGMSNECFAADAASVDRDLHTLKKLAES